MKQALDLPTDIDSLHTLIRQLLSENQHLQNQKMHLQEQIRLLIHKRFGAHSEKYTADQADLFNEAEAYAEGTGDSECIDIPTSGSEDSETACQNRAKTAPKTPGRKALPPELPRVEIIHDLPADQKQCPEGHALKEIGVETSEQLDIIPAKVQDLRHIRKTYPCPCCQNNFKTAPLPPQPIPKSNASPNLLAFIATGKFLDGLPLYRQSRQFERIGVQLPRATLANWMVRCGLLIQPLINLMQDQINAYDIQQIDETRVQVLKEPGKAATTQSYMWVQKGGPPESPVILFTYSPSRGQAVAEQLLEGYRGYVQTDGYPAYANVCKAHGLRQLGCRVDRGVSTPAPHRPGRAGLPHPVPHVMFLACRRIAVYYPWLRQR
jgi:transposase